MGGTLRYFDNALSIGAPGLSVTTSGSSQSLTIPNDASGNRARFVRVLATTGCFVKFTKGAGTCTNADIQLASGWPEIIDCKAYDTISYLQLSAATNLNVTPLET